MTPLLGVPGLCWCLVILLDISFFQRKVAHEYILCSILQLIKVILAVLCNSVLIFIKLEMSEKEANFAESKMFKSLKPQTVFF